MNDCPAREIFDEFLAHHLSAPAEEAFCNHVEDCAACQRALDNLAGLKTPDCGAADMKAISEFLDRIKNADPAKLADFGTPDESLGFLSLPSVPGHLGRLAHYEVVSVIGRGGMGVVFKAFDEKLHRVVAIKALAPQLASSGTARQRFIREARAAAAVSHDHVVAIYAVEDNCPVPYLVMPCIEGVSLEEKLRRRGSLEVKEILRIGLQVAEGLAAAHKQGLVHRDVKPANILLENGVERVRLTDFGLARAVDDARLTQTGEVAGTPLFMAPEQAQGELVDQRTDLFALGSVLYMMCTGRPPFGTGSAMAVLKRVCEDTPQPIAELNPDIPAWLTAIVARLHAKDPARRFPSAAAVAELLGRYLALLQQPQPAQPAIRMEQPREGRGVRRWLPFFAAGCVVLLAAILAVVMRQPQADIAPDVGPPPENAQPKPLAAPPERRPQAHPLDGRKFLDIPADLRALAGGGDPAKAPAELVSVLGDVRFPFVPRNPINGLALSRDGERLVILVANTLNLFDCRTGRLLRSWNDADDATNAAFSPDGGRLAVSTWWGLTGTSAEVRIWDLATGQKQHTLAGHTVRQLDLPRGVGALTWHRDGRRLATGGADGQVKVWDADKGTELQSLAHRGPVGHVVWSPDGKRIAASSGGNDPALRVWEADTGNEIGTRACAGPAAELAWNHDGTLLACAAAKEWNVWKLPDLERAATLPPQRFLAFAANGRSLRTDKDLPALPLAGADLGRNTAIAYRLSPDGKTVYALGTGWNIREPVVRAFDAATGAEHFPNQGHIRAVTSIAVTGGGTTLLSAADEPRLRIWDLATMKMRTLALGPVCATTAALSPDGTTIAAATRDMTIRLFDLASGQERHILRRPPGPVHDASFNRLAFSPKGHLLAAACTDGHVHVWDTAAAMHRYVSPNLHASVRGLAFSPDGKRLAAGMAEPTASLNIWDVAGWKQRSIKTGHDTAFVAVAFLGDSHTLVTASADNAVRAIRLDRDEPPLVLTGPTAPLREMAVHAASRQVAAADAAGKVWVWDLTGTPPRRRVLSLPATQALGVSSMTFSADGGYLFTGHVNGTILVLRPR